MKTLLVLRHAKSSWKDPGLADHDRPLNKRGKRDAPRMGRLLADEDLVPDLIVTSTADPKIVPFLAPHDTGMTPHKVRTSAAEKTNRAHQDST